MASIQPNGTKEKTSSSINGDANEWQKTTKGIPWMALDKFMVKICSTKVHIFWEGQKNPKIPHLGFYRLELSIQCQIGVGQYVVST